MRMPDRCVMRENRRRLELEGSGCRTRPCLRLCGSAELRRSGSREIAGEEPSHEDPA